MAERTPPMAGPVIPPIRKPAWKNPAARPRTGLHRGEQQGEGGYGEHRRADSADAAKVSSWGNCGRPAKPLEIATMKMPVAMMIRSLKILISHPHKGLEIRRIGANAEMTAPTSAFPTPKLRANTGFEDQDPEAHRDAERDEAQHVDLTRSELRVPTRARAALSLPTGTVCQEY